MTANFKVSHYPGAGVLSAPWTARGLGHEALRVAGRDVEDLQDMPVEISRQHFGFERGQQLAERHRLVWRLRGLCRNFYLR
jgi:hypothetical protein